MLSRLLSHFQVLRRGRVAKVLRHPFVWLPACAVIALGSSTRVCAGTTVRPLQSSARMTEKVAPARKVKISKLPHLVAVGPAEVFVQPLAGPRVRKPPLLPAPTPRVEPTPPPEAEAKRADQSQPTPAPQPSAFSPDAPPVLLPAQPPAATPPPEKKAEPRENALEESPNPEPELKDAVMYFETPAGPHGARAVIPAIVPFNSPLGAPQPESRAEYRKENK